MLFRGAALLQTKKFQNNEYLLHWVKTQDSQRQLLSAEVRHMANSNIHTKAADKTLELSEIELKALKFTKNHGFHKNQRFSRKEVNFQWLETRSWPTSYHLNPPDLPGHGNISDRCSAAGRRPLVLATNRNGGMLQLNASRLDDDDDEVNFMENVTAVKSWIKLVPRHLAQCTDRSCTAYV